MKFNKGFDYEGYVNTLTPGLEKSVLKVLIWYVGEKKAVSRNKLIVYVRATVPKVSDRQVRMVINKLRKQGFPICSTGGIDGGYWLAASAEELTEYLDREPLARIKDLQEQVTAMKETRRQLWGEGIQTRLL